MYSSPLAFHFNTNTSHTTNLNPAALYCRSDSLRSSRDFISGSHLSVRRSTSIDSSSGGGVATAGATGAAASSIDSEAAGSATSRSLLRSNARLLRSTDYLLTARKYAQYSTGCAIPFRQTSYRPSSEFSSSQGKSEDSDTPATPPVVK